MSQVNQITAASNGGAKRHIGMVVIPFHGLVNLLEGKPHPFSPVDKETLAALVLPDGLFVKVGVALVPRGKGLDERTIRLLQGYLAENTVLMLVPLEDIELTGAKTLVAPAKRKALYDAMKELLLEFKEKGKKETVRTKEFRGDTLDTTALRQIEALIKLISDVYTGIHIEMVRKNGARLSATQERIIFSKELAGSRGKGVQIDILTRNHVDVGLSFMALVKAYIEHVLKPAGAKQYTLDVKRKGELYYPDESQIRGLALGAFLFNLAYFHEDSEDYRREILGGERLTEEQIWQLRAFLAQKTLDIFKNNTILSSEIGAQLLIRLLNKDVIEYEEKAQLPMPYGELLRIARDYHTLISETPYRELPYARSRAIEHLIQNAGKKYDAAGVDVFFRYVLQPFAIGEVLNLYGEGNKPLCQVRVLEYEFGSGSLLTDAALPKVAVIKTFEGSEFGEGQELSLSQLNRDDQQFEKGEKITLYSASNGAVVSGTYRGERDGKDYMEITEAHSDRYAGLIGREMEMNEVRERGGRFRRAETNRLVPYWLGETVPSKKDRVI